MAPGGHSWVGYYAGGLHQGASHAAAFAAAASKSSCRHVLVDPGLDVRHHALLAESLRRS